MDEHGGFTLCHSMQLWKMNEHGPLDDLPVPIGFPQLFFRLLEGQASRNYLVDHQENDHHIIPYPEQMMGFTMTEKPCGMDPQSKVIKKVEDDDKHTGSTLASLQYGPPYLMLSDVKPGFVVCVFSDKYIYHHIPCETLEVNAMGSVFSCGQTNQNRDGLVNGWLMGCVVYTCKVI